MLNKNNVGNHELNFTFNLSEELKKNVNAYFNTSTFFSKTYKKFLSEILAYFIRTKFHPTAYEGFLSVRRPDSQAVPKLPVPMTQAMPEIPCIGPH